MKSSFVLFTLLALIAGNVLAESTEAPQQLANIGDLPLVSGKTLYDTQIGYRIAGRLNDDRSNVVVFPTWFTGTSGGLFSFGKIGPGLLADTERYYVIVIDALGNGVSTSPSNSERQAGADFPAIAIDDMVRAAHTLVTDHLGFDHVYAVMGISMGGMQTFQWIADYPEFMDKAVAIDGSPRMTSYDIAQWQAHELAIKSLRAGGFGNDEIMEFLPSISVLTLWTPDYFVENVASEAWPQFLANIRQGYVLLDAHDYQAQLEAMMAHDVYADHFDAEKPFPEMVAAELLIIGNPRDHVVNPVPGRTLAESIGARYLEIDSNCGHVGTTCEADVVSAAVNRFLESEKPASSRD